MANIAQVEAGGLVVFSVFKSLLQRPDVTWRNTYEVQIGTPNEAEGTAGQVSEIARNLALWESLFHIVDVRFDRVIASTFTPDSSPYDPNAFLTVPVQDVQGQRSTIGTGEPHALNVCLLVRKVPIVGRNGRNLYRRCLGETDTIAPAGDYVLTEPAQDALEAALAGNLPGQSVRIDEALNNLGATLVMAGVNQSGALNVRQVLAVQAAGVTVKPFNNKYFDRSPDGARR